MKLVLVGLIAIILAAVLSGRVAPMSGKSTQFGTGGLSHTITLYSAGGTVIKMWRTQEDVLAEGGTAYWVGDDGRRIIIAGTFVVEED